MIVVAPRAWQPALQEFVTYKRKLLRVEVRPLEEVLQVATGVDDLEKLKRFLYAEWRERGLRYVLLVGDVDVMPVRYMVLDRVTPAAYDYAFCWLQHGKSAERVDSGRWFCAGAGQCIGTALSGHERKYGDVRCAQFGLRRGATREHIRLGDCWAAAVRFYFEAEHLASLKPNAD